MMLGNLSVEQIEERLGVSFPQEAKELMENTKQANAQHIAKGKWSCFDIPLTLVCGGTEIATEITEALAPLSDKFECELHILTYL